MIKLNKEYLRIIIKEEFIKMILEKKNKGIISKKYKGKTYKAPKSMKGKTWEEKVEAAKKWSDDPEAAAAAATIAIKGKPANKD